MAGTIYDPDTNILINVFKEQFVKLNPEHKGEAEQILKMIRQKLDNSDLGHSFYKDFLQFRQSDWWILKILRIIHTILLLNLPVSVTKMNSDRILLCL